MNAKLAQFQNSYKRNWRQQNEIPQISWTIKKSTKTVLQEADTTRFSINRISKRQAPFFGHVKRREKVQNLVTTGMIVPKQRQKMLMDYQSRTSDRSTESDEG